MSKESIHPAKSPSPATKQQAQELVAQVIAAWRKARDADRPLATTTHDILRTHPELARHESLVLDLAVEEFCLRRDLGEHLDPTQFANQFPSVGTALGSLLSFFEEHVDDVRRLLGSNVSEWPDISEVFGGFLILQELHQSALSHVYLAAELAVGHRLVVLKVSKLQSCEAAVLGRLPHPRIVPILSVCSISRRNSSSVRTRDLNTIVMPFLGCATLSDLVHSAWSTGRRPISAAEIGAIARDGSLGEQLPILGTPSFDVNKSQSFEDAIAVIVVQIAEALQYAHDRGICHRDLKPSNVLLTPNAIPMLMDFDVSVESGVQSCDVAGTLPYMAPEVLDLLSCAAMGSVEAHSTSSLQAMSRSLNVADTARPHAGALRQLIHFHSDHRSDIFSLGVILHQLLTGHLPFATGVDSLPLQARAAHLLDRQHRNPLTRNHTNQHVHDELFHIIDQCLAPTPQQRPQSAAALAGLLSQHLRKQHKTRASSITRRTVLAGLVSSVVVGGVAATCLMPTSDNSTELAEAAYIAGDFEAATMHFSRAIDTLERKLLKGEGDSTAEDSSKRMLGSLYFARAQGFRERDHFANAERDYMRAIEFFEEPRILFCAAFTKGISGDARAAVALYDIALQEMDRNEWSLTRAERRTLSGSARSNLAFYQIRMRLYTFARKNIQLAEVLLDSSDNAMEIGYCNRIELYIRMAKEGFASKEQVLSYARDIPFAKHESNLTGLVHLMAARAAAFSNRGAESRDATAEIVRLLLKAVSFGCSRSMMINDEDVSEYIVREIIPPAVFSDARVKDTSMTDLLLCPVEGLRLSSKSMAVASR